MIHWGTCVSLIVLLRANLRGDTTKKNKKDFTIEKQMPHKIIKYSKCLSYSFPSIQLKIINPFLNLRISANLR